MNIITTQVGPIRRQATIYAPRNKAYAAFFYSDVDTCFEIDGRKYSRGWNPNHVKGDLHEWTIRDNGVTVRVGQDYYFCCHVVRERPAPAVPFSA